MRKALAIFPVCLFMISCGGFSSFTKAQELQQVAIGQISVTEESVDPATPLSLEDQLAKRISIRNPAVVPNKVDTLFFTRAELGLVKDARRGLVTRAPTPSELNNSVAGEGGFARGPRDIKLGGIVYIAQDEWTIWLNNMQVKPKAIPPEVLDLNVYKEYIEIEWFDAFTNQIFPIRLRPNETFNIDSRIFLPG